MYTEKDFDQKFKPRELTNNQELGFYKKEGLWYADLEDYKAQGGTEGSCLMVAGAPDLLDFLAGLNNTPDKVTLEIGLTPLRTSDNNNLDYDILLIRNQLDVEHMEDAGGATYQAILPKVEVFTGCWLCTVNTFVFGGTHPELIFVRVKK